MSSSSIIYLDNSATTRVRSEVLDAMEPFQSYAWGNASSVHSAGRRSRQAVERARLQVASLIGASAEEIFFTPCATYSNNVAILGRARYVEENGLGKHIITSSIEHSSALGPVKHLQSRGWRVTILDVDAEGLVDVDEVRDAIDTDTSIISIMWANNEIGTVQPIEEIAQIAHERGIFFHTDAVQIAGKLPVDVSSVPVDTLSFSGHKFHAPKGIGVLYVRNGVELLPLTFGGGQEDGLFPGTENVANIVGIGKAAELSADDLRSSQQQDALIEMQQILIEKLARLSSVKLTGPRDLSRRVPGHLSFIVDGAIGADICDEADSLGICISSVSACASKKGGHPSHVLKAIGLDEQKALGSVRISAGWFNTTSECERAANILSGIISLHARPTIEPLHALKPLHIASNHIDRRRIDRHQPSRIRI